MIQRIQTILLLLVIVLLAVLFFVPVYDLSALKATTASTQVNGNLLYIPLLLIPLICISILALIAIFSYKNRKRQMKICQAGAVISILISLNAIVFPQFFIHGIDRSKLEYAPGAYLLLANIILFVLAARFIKKDDDLVKAADRLR